MCAACAQQVRSIGLHTTLGQVYAVSTRLLYCTVQDIRAACMHCRRVTTEKYFNGKAVVDDDVAKFVADAVREQLVVAA